MFEVARLTLIVEKVLSTSRDCTHLVLHPFVWCQYSTIKWCSSTNFENHTLISKFLILEIHALVALQSDEPDQFLPATVISRSTTQNSLLNPQTILNYQTTCTGPICWKFKFKAHLDDVHDESNRLESCLHCFLVDVVHAGASSREVAGKARPT